MRTLLSRSTAALLAVLAWGIALPALAQQGTPAPVRSQSANDSQTPHAYRLDFSVGELQGGQRLAPHRYSMTLTAGDGEEVRVSQRVPVATGSSGQFQYVEVGTNIWCRIQERGDDLVLHVRSGITDFAGGSTQENAGQPVTSQVSLSTSTVVTPGKSVILGSVEGPASNKQFQLSVNVSRVR